MHPPTSVGFIIDACNFCQQVCRVNRLRQQLKVVSPPPNHIENIQRGSLPRKQKNLAFRVTLSDENSHVQTAHSGHDNIADYQLRASSFDLCQCALRVVKGTCLIPGSAEDRSERIGNDFLIVYDKYPLSHGISLKFSVEHTCRVLGL